MKGEVVGGGFQVARVTDALVGGDAELVLAFFESRGVDVELKFPAIHAFDNVVAAGGFAVELHVDAIDVAAFDFVHNADGERLGFGGKGFRATHERDGGTVIHSHAGGCAVGGLAGGKEMDGEEREDGVSDSVHLSRFEHDWEKFASMEFSVFRYGL